VPVVPRTRDERRALSDLTPLAVVFVDGFGDEGIRARLRRGLLRGNWSREGERCQQRRD
jgi:hypothetical protein